MMQRHREESKKQKEKPSQHQKKHPTPRRAAGNLRLHEKNNNTAEELP